MKGSEPSKIHTETEPGNLEDQLSNEASDENFQIQTQNSSKKSKTSEILKDIESLTMNGSNNNSIEETRDSKKYHNLRPQNLDEFLRKEPVMVNPTNSTFNLADLSDSEEMWIMDIPKSINPRKLSGHTLSLGERSKIKIGDERYCAVSRNNACCLTLVLNTGRDNKPYKTVNITPAGSVTVRRKLSGISKQTTDFLDDTTVPFPSNLKTRHPFFGSSYDKEKNIRTKVARK